MIRVIVWEGKVVLISHCETFVNTWEVFLLKATIWTIACFSWDNFKVHELRGSSTASTTFTEECVTVACAFLDCKEEITFFSVRSLVTINLNLAEIGWAAWKYNWSNNCLWILFLDNNIWSRATAVNEIAKSAKFLTNVGVVVKFNLISRGSQSWHAANSTETVALFFESTDFAAILLDFILVIFSAKSNRRHANAVTALYFLFNCDRMFLFCHSILIITKIFNFIYFQIN